MLRSARLTLCSIALLIPWGDIQAAKLFVKFVDQQDKPLKEVEAKLVHTESGKELFLKARAKTELEFEAVAKGSHQLMAQRKGFLTVKSDSFVIEEKDLTLRIKLVNLDKFREAEAAGKTAFDQGQYQVALQHFQELNALVPTEPVTWSNLARCHAMLRQRDQALEASRKAALYDPLQFGADFEKSVQATLSFEEGAYFLEQQDYAKAIEALTRSLKYDSTKAETFYSLALAYGQQKKYPEALKNIAEALRLKPDDAGFLEVDKILKHNASVKPKP